MRSAVMPGRTKLKPRPAWRIPNEIFRVLVRLRSTASLPRVDTASRPGSRHRAKAAFKPMLLGGVFQATGNQSPANIPAKVNTCSWTSSGLPNATACRSSGTRISRSTHCCSCGAPSLLQMKEDGRFKDYCHAVFNAIWVDSLNMNDPATAARALTRAGFDAQAVVALANDQATKDALKACNPDGRGARRIRRPDFLRRQSDVLGAGPDGFREGSAAVSNTANRHQGREIYLVAPRPLLRFLSYSVCRRSACDLGLCRIGFFWSTKLFVQQRQVVMAIGEAWIALQRRLVRLACLRLATHVSRALQG